MSVERPFMEKADQLVNVYSKKFGEAKANKFRKWVMEREGVGLLIDPKTTIRLYHVWQQMHKADHFVVIAGREGFGKSTLAFQIASMLCPDFELKNVCYGSDAYLQMLQRKAHFAKDFIKSNDATDLPREAVVLDEGTELLAKESMSNVNRKLTKTFFVQRILKFAVVICIPDFFSLDKVVRLHRVQTLIHIENYGKFKVIVGKGIKLVAEFGQKERDINSVRLPMETFWHGWNLNKFPMSINKREYEGHKVDGIIKLFKDLDDGAQYLGVTTVARKMGCDPRTLTNRIRNGQIDGKLIGQRWFMAKSDAEKLDREGIP